MWRRERRAPARGLVLKIIRLKFPVDFGLSNLTLMMCFGIFIADSCNFYLINVKDQLDEHEMLLQTNSIRFYFRSINCLRIFSEIGKRVYDT